MMERLEKQMEFILEVDKVKKIVRQTYLSDASRKENDAEHSWHLALMAVLLKEYSNEEVDLATKAADRIFGLLPSDQGTWLRELWEEFEAYETAEAKFAHVLDNAQPLLLNDASNGRSWAEHGVHKSQIYKRNEHTSEGSREIWEYMKKLVDKHIQLGHVIDD